MSINVSTRTYQEFFKTTSRKNYAKFETDPTSIDVFDFLQKRIDILLAGIVNVKKPPLQMVIVDLEDLLRNTFGWKGRQDVFFITCIGAMVAYLVEEFGYVPDKRGIRLKNNQIIRTSTIYK